MTDARLNSVHLEAPRRQEFRQARGNGDDNPHEFAVMSNRERLGIRARPLE